MKMNKNENNKNMEENKMDNTEIVTTTESSETTKTTTVQKSSTNTEITSISPDDFIPCEEKAIVIDWSLLHVNMVEESVESFMPENERALQSTPEEAEKLTQQLRLMAIAGMGHIQGVLEDRLYAQILVDEQNERKFVFCMDQKEGNPCRFEISQANVFRLAYAQYDVSNLDAYEQKKMRDVLRTLEDSVLNKWVDGNRPMPLVDVVEALFRSRKQLPVITRVPVDNRREMYEKIKDSMSSLGNCYVEKTTYYAFYPEYIHYLANSLGMKERPFLKKLSELNLLYLQPSCEGYQARVRIDENFSARMVCIYRLDKIPEAAGGYAKEAKENEEQAQALFEKL